MKTKYILGLFCVVCLLVVMPLTLAQSTVITVDNAADVTQIMRLGRGQAQAVDFSPNGDMIAVASSIGVWLYSADAVDTVAEPPLLVTVNPVNAVAFSPDGSLVAAGDDGEFVTLWDVATQEMLAEIAVGSGTNDMAFSSDGTLLVTANTDRNLRLWDVLEGAEIALMEGHSSTIYGVAFSPDDSAIASSSDDRTVRLWDASDGSEIAVIEGSGGGVYDVNFSPDGSTLITGGTDYAVRLWDAATGEELLLIEETETESGGTTGHTSYVNATLFSPDGSVFVTASDDRTVQVWDAAGEFMAKVEVGSYVEDAAFSPDGSQLVTIADTTMVQVWDLASGELVSEAAGHTDSIMALDFTSDGENMILADDGGRIWVWNRSEMAEITELPSSFDEITFSADNDSGAVFSPDDSYIAFTDGFDIQIWSADLSEQLGLLEGEGLATNLAISPDSSMLVFVGSDGVYLFDVANQSLIASYYDHTEWVQKVAWSPDQTYFVTGADDGSVRIYAVPE